MVRLMVVFSLDQLILDQHQLSVCWSGLHGFIAYSLLGVGIPNTEQRLCGTLDSVPLKYKFTTCCTRLSSLPGGVQEVSPPPHSTGAACA